MAKHRDERAMNIAILLRRSGHAQVFTYHVETDILNMSKWAIQCRNELHCGGRTSVKSLDEAWEFMTAHADSHAKAYKSGF